MKSLAPAAAAPPFLQAATNADVHSHIDRNAGAHLAAIQDFIRQKSISSENVGVRECAGYVIREELSRGGMGIVYAPST